MIILVFISSVLNRLQRFSENVLACLEAVIFLVLVEPIGERLSARTALAVMCEANSGYSTMSGI
jgi:hypothetical protein